MLQHLFRYHHQEMEDMTDTQLLKGGGEMGECVEGGEYTGMPKMKR